jgi:hypothetical protein
LVAATERCASRVPSVTSAKLTCRTSGGRHGLIALTFNQILENREQMFSSFAAFPAFPSSHSSFSQHH